MMKADNLLGGIFDVDDTLLDNGAYLPGPANMHTHTRLLSAHHVGEELGIEQLQGATLDDMDSSFRNAALHGIEHSTWQLMIQLGCVPAGDVDNDNSVLTRLLEHKHRIHANVLRDHGREVPGALDFVSSLHGMSNIAGRLAVASSAPRDEIDIFFTAAGFAAYFDDERIISKEMIARPKPDPEVFDRAFLSLGLSDTVRERVLVVEDDHRGVAGAKEAGLLVVGITTKQSAERLAGADAVVDSYAELADLLEFPS